MIRPLLVALLLRECMYVTVNILLITPPRRSHDGPILKIGEGSVTLGVGGAGSGCWLLTGQGGAAGAACLQRAINYDAHITRLTTTTGVSQFKAARLRKPRRWMAEVSLWRLQCHATPRPGGLIDNNRNLRHGVGVREGIPGHLIPRRRVACRSS